MIWKCEKCGHELRGEISLPVRCFCKQSETEKAGQWPLWAKLIALRRIESDTGVGDTVQRHAAKIGGERFKKLAKRLGIPCGCTERQAEWNILYKYKNTLRRDV